MSRRQRGLWWWLLLTLLVPVPAASAPAGACASAHPLATQVCVDTLSAGGNAFDAAVATSAMLAVVEPFGSGFGGGGFFLLRQGQREVFLDGRETAPLAAQTGMYRDDPGQGVARRALTGMLAAAIPHQPALLAHTAERYGSRPLASLLAPAIRAATEGFVIDWRLAGEIARHAPRMDAAMRAVFVPGDRPLSTGERLVQADLGDTLRRFAANGVAEFQRGETAQRLLAGVRAGGGIWAAEDLARVRIVERVPLVGWFRDYRVVTAPPPSAGGAAILQALAMLEAGGFRTLDGEAAKHQVVESLRRAYRDRNRYFGDPDFVEVPLPRLLAGPYLRRLAAGIGERATPSRELPAESAGQEQGETTHFSVLDAQGNRVAGTQTLNLFFGAAAMAPGTGIVLNDEMDDFSSGPGLANAYGLAGSEANAIAPGKRPLSSMSPSFVDGPRGSLVIGTPGGSRIPSMVLLGILRFTEGASAAGIAATGRFHHQWQPDQLSFEPEALSAAEQSALAARGHALRPLQEPYGNLQLIVRDPDGKLSAAADPRWVGTGALAPETVTP